MVSEASLKVPETLDHFWVDIWLLNSGLIGLNEWFAFLLKKETLAAILTNLVWPSSIRFFLIIFLTILCFSLSKTRIFSHVSFLQNLKSSPLFKFGFIKFV